MIQLSENAQRAILRLQQEQGRTGSLFRVSVKGGGCSGMTYDVKLDDTAAQGPQDRMYDINGVRLVTDVKSLLYLDGMTIDFSTELVGGGFRFVNPNAKGSCGCGTSFTV